ncbi:hypothetical protein KIH39_22905 [Telmatocola sphagniphila]|uniref:Uncharacterized protein n=1 Tax=Telmatocola sphagniphila TaxID=1123043 RepID=A0A8E6B491_9BACT|nr:hypothetical protein [Telmatocola sphagniphila]QVL31663.1 hypothetical protein KIH39_22905 [Telmatocola sphagniphila]
MNVSVIDYFSQFDNILSQFSSDTIEDQIFDLVFDASVPLEFYESLVETKSVHPFLPEILKKIHVTWFMKSDNLLTTALIQWLLRPGIYTYQVIMLQYCLAEFRKDTGPEELEEKLLRLYNSRDAHTSSISEYAKTRLFRF